MLTVQVFRQSFISLCLSYFLYLNCPSYLLGNQSLARSLTHLLALLISCSVFLSLSFSLSSIYLSVCLLLSLSLSSTALSSPTYRAPPSAAKWSRVCFTRNSWPSSVPSWSTSGVCARCVFVCIGIGVLCAVGVSVGVGARCWDEEELHHGTTDTKNGEYIFLNYCLPCFFEKNIYYRNN
jgi:hypothetical protein